MNALLEETTQTATANAPASPSAQGAGRRPAAKKPVQIWGILMVSAAIGFGLVMLVMTPTLYSKLVEAHQGNPVYAVATSDAKGGAGGGGGAVDPAAVLRGKALFAQGCNACHGDDARGRPGLGKDLVHSAFVKTQGNPQLVGFLKKGRDIGDPLNTTKVPMPPKGGNPALQDKQLTDLAEYLRGIQQ
jgi:disulfide bond formation protein DsbB